MTEIRESIIPAAEALDDYVLLLMRQLEEFVQQTELKHTSMVEG